MTAWNFGALILESFVAFTSVASNDLTTFNNFATNLSCLNSFEAFGNLTDLELDTLICLMQGFMERKMHNILAFLCLLKKPYL